MKRLAPIGAAFFLIACQPKNSFDTAKWSHVSASGEYTYRASLERDLLEHHLKKGMSYAEIIALLGQPNSGEAERFRYLIVDQSVDSYTHTRTLILILDDKRTVQRYYVNDEQTSEFKKVNSADGVDR